MKREAWLQELNRYLSVLPAEESRRVAEYYGEMIADRLEAGRSEAEVLEQMGDPYDVARSVIASYRAENPDYVMPSYDAGSGYAKAQQSSTAPKTQPASDRGTLWTVLCVLFCIPVVLWYIVLAGIAVAFVVTLIALYGCGIWLIVLAFIEWNGFLLLFGGGLALLGLSIVLTPWVWLAIKWMFRGTKMLLDWAKRKVLGEAK